MTIGSGNLLAETLNEVADKGLLNLPAVKDPLADALHYLRMDGMFYCRSELRAPWGLELPEMPGCLWFHVVTEGECLLTDSAGLELMARAGDIVVLPQGSAHLAADDRTSKTPIVFDLPHDYISRSYAILHHGGDGTTDGGGPEAKVICGVVQLGHPAAQMLLENLPEVIHIEAAGESEQWDWLPALLGLMAVETQATRPGGETVVTRLCDVLIIQAIRWWIENDPAAKAGWLGALRDPIIGQALSLMHSEPANDWTVTSLAAAAGISRSGFSARFGELVGTSPKHYLTRWRMQLGHDMLRTSKESILAIATQLGYQSEAAFSRAFKRETGSAPSHVRRADSLKQDPAGT